MSQEENSKNSDAGDIESIKGSVIRKVVVNKGKDSTDLYVFNDKVCYNSHKCDDLMIISRIYHYPAHVVCAGVWFHAQVHCFVC